MCLFLILLSISLIYSQIKLLPTEDSDTILDPFCWYKNLFSRQFLHAEVLKTYLHNWNANAKIVGVLEVFERKLI